MLRAWSVSICIIYPYTSVQHDFHITCRSCPFNSKTMDVSSGTGRVYSFVALAPQLNRVCFRVRAVLCLVYCVVFS